METQKILIEIDVDATQSTQEIVKQRAALEVLRKEKAELLAQNKLLAAQENVDTETIQKNNAAIVEKEAKIKNLSAEIKSNEKIIQAATKTTQDETGAYQKLALEYQVAAQKAKDLAVVHGVNSEEAKKATAAANAMDAQLKEVDKSVGQNQRNVGNYSSALDNLGGGFIGNLKNINEFTEANGGLSGSFKGGITAVQGFGKELLTLLANPIVAVIAAIAGAVMLMVEAVKSNGEATEKLNQVLAPFKTLLSAVMQVISQVATFFIDAAMSLVKFGSAIASVITGNEQLAESTKKAMALEKERQVIAEQERADIVDDAKLRLQTAELKKEIAQKDKYTAEQRIAMAREIDNLEKANMKDDMDRQIRRHNNLLNQYKLEGKAYKDLTNEQKDALRQSEADIYNIKAEYFEATKRIGKQESAAREEVEAEKTKAIKEAEKAREEASKKAAEAKQKRQDDDLKKTLNLLTIEKNEYKDKYDVEKLLDEKYFESKKSALQEIHDEEIALIDKKKKYGKLTIEEEQLARAEADKNLLDSTNKLYSDLNAQLASNIDYQLKLDDLKNKQSLVGTKQTEEQKYQATVSGINKRYEAEKEKIELTVKDEAEKNEKLALLNAQYNLDIATANQANQDAIDKQKLIDEAELLQSKFELQQNGIDKEYQQKFDALEKEKKERLAKVTEGSEAEFAIKQEYAAKEAELERQKNLAKAQAIVDIAAKTMEVLESVNKFFDALGERELDNFKKLKDKELSITIENNNKAFDSVTANYNSELANLNEQLANKLISQEDYDAAKKKLDADYADAKKSLDDKNKEAEKKAQDEIDEKKAEIEYQAAKRAKALAIANAIINGASAVIAALATPFAGPALAVAAGIMAAANLATIIATPIPDNRKGTSSSTSGGSNPTTTASVPNTANTTNGIVNGNTSNNTAVTTAIVTGNQNDTTNYVPVLVTSDLTYEFDKSAKIEVMNQLN